MGNNGGREFRDALGSFATGVTIVTTTDDDGRPVGVTASSFNSVSLDPPLVLWSLARQSNSHDCFCESGHFAIHVLASNQEGLSNHFAKSGTDKFADIDWSPGQLGSPVIAERAALFECQTKHIYEGGDHTILVGEVVNFAVDDLPPLLFHGGRYAERRPMDSGADEPPVDVEQGRFSDDFLSYLVSRAHFQASLPIRKLLDEADLSMSDYLVIAFLSMSGASSAADIIQSLEHTGLAPTQPQLDGLVARQLLEQSSDGFDLNGEGRRILIKTLAYGKVLEERVAECFTPSEMAETKRVLKKLIDLTGKQIPIAWRDSD